MAAPRFAHAAEAEMAAILDFYGVRWEYEPRTFPIAWLPDGKVAESFTPDFWLPELDLYLECTTLPPTNAHSSDDFEQAAASAS